MKIITGFLPGSYIIGLNGIKIAPVVGTEIPDDAVLVGDITFDEAESTIPDIELTGTDDDIIAQLEALPATAAGGEAPAGTPLSDGSNSNTIIDATRLHITPESGFETIGLHFDNLEAPEFNTYEEPGIPEAPDAEDDYARTIEGQYEQNILNGNVLDNDTYSIVTVIPGTFTGEHGGTLTIFENGDYNYIPPAYVDNRDSDPVDVFEYTIVDDYGQESTATLNIVIGDTEPLARDDYYELDEDTFIESTLANNDNKGEDNPHIWALESNPSNGTVKVNADGTFVYTPNDDFYGNDEFVYTITDNDGDVTSATAYINVNPVDDPPVIDVIANDFVEDSGVLVGDQAGTYTTFDKEGHAVTVTFNTISPHYTLDPANNQVLLTQAGVDIINAGKDLDDIDLKVTQDSNVSLFGTDLDTPIVTPVNDPPVVTTWSDTNNTGEFESAQDDQIANITIEINSDGDNPGTDKEFIGDILKERKAITPEQVASNPPADTVLNYTSDITFTFIDEGAGYKNTVGWYDVNDPTVGYIVWENSSKVNSGGDLIADTSTFTVSDVPAGTQLGFFLIKNLYKQTQEIPEDIYFKDGKAYFDDQYTKGYETFFSNEEDISVTNQDGLQHVITGVSPDEDHTLFVGFEDLTSGGDKDYNDVIFKVDLGKWNSTSIDAETFNVGVTITDEDDTYLTNAFIAFDLGANDKVTFENNTGLTVTRTDDSFSIEGHALIADYNSVLDSFVIEIGNTGLNGDYTLIDHSDRTSQVQVWDADGNMSNISTATYQLEVTVLDYTLPDYTLPELDTVLMDMPEII